MARTARVLHRTSAATLRGMVPRGMSMTSSDSDSHLGRAAPQLAPQPAPQLAPQLAMDDAAAAKALYCAACHAFLFEDAFWHGCEDARCLASLATAAPPPVAPLMAAPGT